MAHGFPLLGDKIYYGSYPMFQSFKDRYAKPEDYELMELPRHALHATAINIPWEGGAKDNTGEERRTFFCPPPLDMTNWIRNKLSLDYDQFLEDTLKVVEDYFSKDFK